MLRWGAVKCKIRNQPPPKKALFGGGVNSLSDISASFDPNHIIQKKFQRSNQSSVRKKFLWSGRNFYGPKNGLEKNYFGKNHEFWPFFSEKVDIFTFFWRFGVSGVFRRVLWSIKIFSERSKLALQNLIFFITFWYPKSNKSNTLVEKHHKLGHFRLFFSWTWPFWRLWEL